MSETKFLSFKNTFQKPTALVYFFDGLRLLVLEKKRRRKNNNNNLTYPISIFKTLPLWADAFYKSICWSINVRLSVHFSRYRLNVFMPPHPKLGCPKILEIQNPWGKVMERSGLRFENFYK